MKKIVLLTVCCLLVCISGISQQSSKKIGLVWDSSYGMIDRNMDAEINYLNDYFLLNSNVEVRLVVFSNTILAEEVFQVSGGQWIDLKTELTNAVPDGATIFTKVFPTAVDEIFFVSDGKSAYDDLPENFNVPITVLSSVPGSNITALKTLAENSGGTFIDLNAVSSVSLGSSTFFEALIVKGIVTTQAQLLSNVQVYSRENNKSTVTKSNGSYQIEAVKDGILEFSYIGMKTYITRVPPGGVKNVQMKEGGESLEEVYLSAEVKKEPEDMVQLGTSKKSKRTLGYAVETITDDDIGDHDLSLENSIQGQFSNVSLASNQDISQYLARGRNMSILLDQTGIIVVDGVPMASDPQISTGLGGSDKSILTGSGILDPSNIAEISVLKGLAATNRWGTLGRNGVILITTKTSLAAKPVEKKVDVIQGTTDTYEGGALQMTELPEVEYIRRLKQATSVDDAYQVYLRQRNIYGNDTSYFLNSATYFKKWNNNFMIDKILSNISELPQLTSEVRTAQAYKYQELGLYSKAIPIYKSNINKEPKQIQHYRNLALSYERAGQYDEALTMYKRIDRMQIRGITTYDALQPTIDNEYKNLISQHKDKVNLAGINPMSLQNAEIDTRIVFEWNAFDAEFDLQIVNPQQRFFTWSHTQQAEPSRFNKEKELGYGLEEFFMTREDQGDWLFNMTYFGKRNGDNRTPTYVKITRYDNFGRPNQKQSVKVIALEALNQQQSVLTVKIDG